MQRSRVSPRRRSLVPKGASERVKTDRREAVRLTLAHRGDVLTAIRIPFLAEEAVRDLVRARGDLLDGRKPMQQRLNPMLLRHGRIWRGCAKITRIHQPEAFTLPEDCQHACSFG